MKVNGEGIYGSTPIPPYKTDNIYLTTNGNGDIYFFYLMNEENILHDKVELPGIDYPKTAKLKILGTDFEKKIKKKEDN